MSSLQEQITRLREKIASWETLRDEVGEEVAGPKIAALKSEILRLQAEAGETVPPQAAPGRGQVRAALADRSVMIEGSAERMVIVTGDGNRITVSADQLDPRDLLQAYMRALAVDCGRLPLGQVDPSFTNPRSQEQVTLQDVYTDLHVVSPLSAEDDAAEKQGRRFGFHLSRGDDGQRVELLTAIAEPQARLVVLVGDAGSGKTTFVSYLAHLLAEAQVSGRPPDLPDSLRDLLPVRLVLRYAQKYLPADGTCGTAGMLWDALLGEIAARLGQAAAQRLLPFLQAQVMESGGLFLLDGLDEVPEADRRRQCLLQAIQDLAGNLPEKSRVLLTARPYAYADPKWRLPKFGLLALAPFDEGQVLRFVNRFYQAVRSVMGWDAATAGGRATRLAGAIRQKPYLADLASRPLLLTLMSTLDSSRGKLPEDRADLYEESVKLLLSRWQRGREVRNDQGQIDWEPSISKALGIGEDRIRAALEKLAYLTHEIQATDADRTDESADIPRSRVLEVFAGVVPEDLNADVLIRYLEHRSGLLLGRRENVYSFPHRSFQEYLAACHLASVEQDFAGRIRALLTADPDWWREVFLLGVGKIRLGSLGGAVGVVGALLPAEVKYTKKPTEADWQIAALAGQALLELRLAERAPGEVRFDALTDRVRRWLVRIVEDGRLAPRRRLEAGDVLGALGDPRFDSRFLHLPAFFHGRPEPFLGFVEVPAGPFRMGSEPDDREAWADERPAHTLDLPRFWIARYPVTNAQYRHFLAEGGYDREEFWTQQGWAWRNGAEPDFSPLKNFSDQDWVRRYKEWVLARKDRSQPFFSEDPQWGTPTRPVVGVTWFEAMAFARWLDARLRALRPDLIPSGYVIRLPTEAEWEKAARGPQGLRWPWGNDWKEDRANSSELDLGETSPVGVFPKGRSPCGALDLAGNVWEWTHSLWGMDILKPDFGYPYRAGDGREQEDADGARVLRGGSWCNLRGTARGACRDWSVPATFDANAGFRVVVSLAGPDF